MLRRILILSALVGLPCAAGCSSTPASSGAELGVFDRTRVLVAYYGSEQWDARLQELRRERDAALARGDAEAAAAAEQQGVEHQEHAHRQLSGVDDVDDILADIEPVLAEVRAESGVVEIREKPKFGLVLERHVDVTDLITKRLTKTP